MKYLRVDTSKCNGAMKCVTTCAQAFFKTDNSQFSSIQVKKSNGHYEINVCNQCGECIPYCPVGAISRNKAGVVVIDKKKCVGCFICVGFCPTLSMRRADGLKEPFKCIACGLCTKNCPNNALEIVEKDNSQACCSSC